MDIHQSWKAHVQGFTSLVCGILLLFAPWGLSLVGREFLFGNWIGYLLGALGIIGGAYFLFRSFSAYALRIEEAGIRWTRGKTSATLTWDAVERVTLERKANEKNRVKPTQLVVWTHESVQTAFKPATKVDGLNGYLLADIRHLQEPRAEVESALQRFSAGRYATVS